MTDQQAWNLPANRFRRESIEDHGVTVSIWIHGKPEHTFDTEDGTITAARMRTYAAEMNAQLTTLADTLATLEEDGWGMDAAGYEVHLSHMEVMTAKQARARLKSIGLKLKDFQIQDF